jgi:peptide/nickel transport system substrate-binding protein
MKRVTLIVTTLLLMAGVLFAGGKREQPAAAQPAKEEVSLVQGVLPRNQTVIAAMLTGRVGAPSNFNEWVGWKNRDRGMQQLMNEPLWSVEFATGKIIAGLASGDAVYNADFTQVTIPLRKGVTWSDGVPFTSADVVFTIELHKKTDGFNNTSVIRDNVASVSAPDDHTVVVKLKKPNSRFHTNFLDRWGCIWIMPKHVFEKAADPITFDFNPPVSSGPYKLHSFDPAGEWTIWEKREDWKNSPTGILYGEPKPKYIVYQNFGNEGAKIMAQLTHQLDVVDLSASGMNACLVQGETNRAYQSGYPWVVNNDPCMTGICFNALVPPYDNREVRWALLLAIDITKYMAQAVDGQATLSPVHIPSLGAYPDTYIKPMQEWLSNFTLDLGGGKTFKPYDPTAPQKIVEYAKSRGFVVTDDKAVQEKAFGLGWYKYAPDAAEALLKKNGFSKDANGKWLLPNGKPWRIELIGTPSTSHHGFLNGNAAVQQWKLFGIDAVYTAIDNKGQLTLSGDYSVCDEWPAAEPWGAGVDLYRTLDLFNSEYVQPIGAASRGHQSHWSHPDMDAVLEKLGNTDPSDLKATAALGMEGLKILVREMPGIPTYGYTGFTTWDQYYWKNWPFAENAYTQPYSHWGPFKYLTPFLEPTGR